MPGTNRLLNRALWAGGMPNGLGEVKPHHYLEILRTIRENWRHPRYAWRILADGVAYRRRVEGAMTVPVAAESGTVMDCGRQWRTLKL